jgi:hypothetical protein
MRSEAELVDGFRLYPIKNGYMAADGGGWLPGWFPTRHEALAGAHATSQKYGYTPIGAGDDVDLIGHDR